jgi:4-aminobutyrate aminotransferase-like enzyme
MTQMAKWKELSDIGIPISTPSPEAIVRAALERAADKVSDMMYLLSLGRPEEGPFTRQDRTCKETREQASEAIRALASDPAEVAAIIAKAGEDRG